VVAVWPAQLRSTDKKGNPVMYDLEDKINFAVFPGLQVRRTTPGREST
jgi:hypothetical protein